MDNASTHHSKIVKDFIKDQKFCVAFILTYSLKPATVEKYSALLKRIVSKQVNITPANCKDRNSMNLIKI